MMRSQLPPRSTPTRWALALTGAFTLLMAAQETAVGQSVECAQDGGRLTTLGWAAYREGKMEVARERFSAALECEPGLRAGTNGLAYVALRAGALPKARQLFVGVLLEDPEDVDAVMGLGLVDWREGAVESATAAFRRVRRLDPQHAEARELLQRIEPEPLRDLGPPPAKPDSTVYPARTAGDRFEVRGPDGWKPFYIKGVNLGAALPGRHPSQFPDSATYAGWIDEMAELGANTIRVYTIHPPHFYQVLRAHNERNRSTPLWLLHGVWAELPPDGDYLDTAWESAFFAEMRRVVDLLHGWAELAPRPGHAAGSYTADVSEWTLGYIIGREWEPFSVQEFNALYPEMRSWEGRYLRVAGGEPMDAWLAKACEEMIAYEMETFGAQRPIAYTNWPTLDPLHHPTETTVEEEIRLRAALGEKVARPSREYDNDAVGLDAALVSPTDELAAGFFAAYHAYPYYPDFMALDPAYYGGHGPEGRSNYFAYLTALRERLPGIPIVIAEYGVPASLGTAHLQPQGWHHGGHDERAMARVDARLTREIAAAGMAGGAIFAWIDEWFKKNWLVIDFEIPLDRNRLWLNRLDAEQHYGILALEPARAFSGGSIQDRLDLWADIPPLYRNADGMALRATADEAYLWLLFEPGAADEIDELLIGFDTLGPDVGDFTWPGQMPVASPVGLEFVLRATAEEVRLLVDPPSNPIRQEAVRTGLDASQVSIPPIDEAPPPGLFTGRFEQRYRRPLRSTANADGRYDSLRVITNRPRFGRDGQEFTALGYDRGVLPRGPTPDGLWQTDPATRAVEIRIPWGLLNVTDPSQRRILQDEAGGSELDRFGREGSGGEFGTVTVEGFRLVAAARLESGGWRMLPASGEASDVRLYAWPTWEEPTWRSRRRPVFAELQELFSTLQPYATRQQRVVR